VHLEELTKGIAQIVEQEAGNYTCDSIPIYIAFELSCLVGFPFYFVLLNYLVYEALLNVLSGWISVHVIVVSILEIVKVLPLFVIQVYGHFVLQHNWKKFSTFWFTASITLYGLIDTIMTWKAYFASIKSGFDAKIRELEKDPAFVELLTEAQDQIDARTDTILDLQGVMISKEAWCTLKRLLFLENMKDLNLANTNFSAPEIFDYFDNLEELCLENVSADLRDEIRFPDNLKVLKLGGTKTLDDLSSITFCDNLERLDWPNTKISLQNLSLPLPLKELNLMNTDFSAPSLKHLTNLTRLNLSECIGDLAELELPPNLTHLVLAKTNFQAFDQLQYLPLQYLNLRQSKVSIGTIQIPPSITKMNLSFTNFSNSSSLSELQYLQVLNLQKVTGDLSGKFSLPRSITTLIVKETNFDDWVGVVSLPNLQELDFQKGDALQEELIRKTSRRKI